MSWLLFMDESGHDHKTMPYEVRGGVAVNVGKLWDLVRSIQQAEFDAFGCRLSDYGSEIKGSKLLDKKRLKFAQQRDWMVDDERRKHARIFLTKGLEQQTPTRVEFSAYGQASLHLARAVFQALRANNAKLFASVVPPTIEKPDGFEAEEYLRKDHVFLLERFFYFLEAQSSHGVLVFDSVDHGADQKFVRQIERYFTATRTGVYRTQWIVPVPLFVSSAMSYVIQAADLCIYCLNWGFRLPSLGMDASVRQEIADEFGPWLNSLQYRGQGSRDGRLFDSYGIVYVPEPYGAAKTGGTNEKRQNL